MSSEQEQQQQKNAPADKKKGEGIKKIEYQNKTPVGHKKDVSGEMEAAYYPAAVEAAWYSWWEKCNFFQANNDANDKREKFVIMLPPPNVTGSLHLGHTLTVAIQDSIVRYHRMQGKNVLYLPGTDHAGIATQVVVEKKLQKEQNLSRHDLGREEFLKKVWEWKEQYGSRIFEQLRRTGASLDWSRECFTMDEPRSKAVNEAFVRMYEKGYIFRDTRLVNWCCHLRTAISNIEVDHKEFTQPKKIPVPGHDPKKTYEFGYIWEFAYKIENSDEEIVVATTRPETMLGDTAIAVHPEEEKYKHLHGKFAVHPFNGRRLPIVCDPILVEKGFGTGAVKVTPAHDHNDFLCGKRNNLEFINILNDDGTLNANAAPFTGLMRYEARYQVTKALDEKKLLRAKKPHNLNVGVCSRSGDVIEPMIKPQWFVNCKELAKKAVELSESGDLMIYPRNEQATWKRWLDNIQDWCISRQLWWGHRIPAYYINIQGQAKGDVADGKYWVVARSKEEALKVAAERFGVDQSLVTLDQDDDVLDTWFSSGLFPFATLGWPDNTADLAQFYPGNLLETGLDILFFWVARMVMMGLALMDKLPFTSVFLHSIVRDKNGKKMSKSTGNVIDPIDVIEGIELPNLNEKLKTYNLSEADLKNAVKLQAEQFPKGIPECGTDALRFCLLNYCTMGKDINLDVQRVFGYRTFCNKMWNATRFAFINLQGFKPKSHDELPDMNTVSFMDKWILSRLNNAIKIANESILAYDFYTHTNALYDFFLKELCDVYLEAIKPIMYGDNSNEQAKRAAQITLYTCLEQSYRLMHPAMPFITEELWQRLPGRDLYPKNLESIMLNPYPAVQPNWTNADVESKTELVMEIVRKIRSIKAVYTIKQKPNVFIKCDAALSEDLSKQTLNIQTLAVCGEVKINDTIPEGCGVQIVNAQCEVHILLKGLINFAAELEKLQKQQQKIQKALDELEKKMKSDKYQKVPPSIQEEDRAKVEDSKTELQKLADSIATLNKFVEKQ